MATRSRTVIDPSEDPRLPGNDIPECLYRVCQRWSDKSPSSPSLEGFQASSSGLTPTKENPDNFPASLLHLEVFYDNYCGIMNNPLTFKTTAHAHFVGLFSSRFLAEREAELLRKGSTTEYRVYCVRGAELRDRGVSIIRGRAIVTIGREPDRQAIHTNPTIGEEFLVWGRVPVEAVVGSWGADGVMQLARVRQEAQRQRGPPRRVAYIHNFLPGPEVSAEEALAFADSLVYQSRAGQLDYSQSSNGRPQLSGPAPPIPPYHLPGLLTIAPPQSQQRPYQSPYGGTTSNLTFNAHALQEMVLAPPPPVPSMNGQALRSLPSPPQSAARSLDNPGPLRTTQPQPQQRPYQSPYGRPGQINVVEETRETESEMGKESEVVTEGDSDDDARHGV